MAATTTALTPSVIWLRRLFRRSEVPLGMLAIVVGLVAGLASLAQGAIARGMQRLFYVLEPGQRLSSLDHVPLTHLLALPLGGVMLGGIAWWTHGRIRAPIDVVEANALYGGDIPLRDSLLVAAQTIVSNGCGASVGLEAAYAQMGGGLASLMGRWLRLRRVQLRQIVGAGAGAAVGAAFGSPLTGAFYAFEVVIGAYTPAAIAPVAIACLVAAISARTLGAANYAIALPTAGAITTADYVLFAALGILCAALGVAVMRLVTVLEWLTRRLPVPDRWRPVAGGLVLIPLALISPQALSAGHGALHLDMETAPTLGLLLTVLVVKVLASSVSLGFGFRGGLFFASLFIGSLVGQIFAALLALLPGHPPLDPNDAAMVGMAGMAVAIVGGPLTMPMLVLEATHDFTLAAGALIAAVSASTIVRETFGFSFSTWRMHTRGETIRSARDVSWTRRLTAGQMMRREFTLAHADLLLAEGRGRYPLGTVRHVVMVGPDESLVGVLPLRLLHSARADGERALADLPIDRDCAMPPDAPLAKVLRAFEVMESEMLVVVDRDHKPLGVVTESDVRRRYTAELERSQRELFGE